MRREIQDYIYQVLHLFSVRFPESNPYHKFWIDPDSGKLSLVLFIGEITQAIDFTPDERDKDYDNETPEDLVESICSTLREAGYNC